MKEVHQLSLDEYESKIGTYVQDIIPVEETDEIVRKTEKFTKSKAQNLHDTLKKKPVTQNYISPSISSTDKNSIPKPSKLQVTSTQKEKSVTMTIMTPPKSPTTPKNK